MKLSATLTFASILLASSLANQSIANDLDVRINNDAIHGNISIFEEDSELLYGLGYFYKDADPSISVANVDLQSRGQTALGNMPTTVGLGIQANYFKQDHIKGTAVGLGGSVRVNIPDVPGVSLETAAHFAPDVVAFGDAKRFMRFRGQINYRVIRSADLSAGYRYMNTKLENGGKVTLESGLFVGLKLNF